MKIRLISALCNAAFCLTALTGCAGFHGGSFSVPWIGEQEPSLQSPKTPFERAELSKIRLPDLLLELNLNNATRSWDYTVVLFVIPSSFDLNEEFEQSHQKMLNLDLSITPSVEGWTLETALIEIRVDELRMQPVTVRSAPQSNGLLSARASEQTRLRLTFDAPIPSPDSRIELDLSKALKREGSEALPLIKFKKLDWSAGYT